MISLLYVDDEPALLEICKLYLERKGIFTVDTTESAPTALEKIHTTSYDAIISDFQMPDMDGIEFLKALRSSGDETPFIIFTGKGREEVVIKAFESGADFYLQKGGEPKAQFTELEHKVKQAVKLRKAGTVRRESEKRLISIIDFLPDATFALDKDGRVIMWNRAIEKMTGVSADDMVGKGNYEYALLFYGERRPILIDLALQDYDEVKSKYTYIRREDGRLVAETLGARLQGKEVVLWGMASPLYDSYGQLTGAIESIRDITDQKQAEEAIRRSEGRSRALIENASDLIRILDRNGRIVFDSAASMRILGYPSGSTIGRSPLEYIHPDDYQRVLDEFQQVFDRTNPGIPTEFRIRRADGSYTWVESLGKNLIGVPGVDGIVITSRFIDERKKADTAIRESEERFRAIAEQSPDIIFITDAQGIIMYVSPVVEVLFGYPQKDVIGRHFAAVLPKDEQEKIIALFASTMEHGTIVKNYELQVQRKDGTVFFGELNASAYRAGNFYGVAGVFRDITDRKRAEEAFHESYAVLNGIVESPRNVVIFALDREYRYLAFNDNHRRTMKQIWGVDIAIGVSMLAYISVASDRERAKENFDRALSGESFTITEEYGDLSHERRWYEDTYNPIFDKDGTIIGLTLFLTDVTGRNQTEQALRESEERFRLLAENTTDTIWMMQTDGTFTYHSPAVEHLRGYTPEEADSLTLNETFTPASLGYIMEIFQEEGRKPVAEQWPDRTIELEMFHKGGTTVWTEVSIRAVRDAKGNVTHLQGSTRDITRRKMVEEAIRQSEEKFRTLLENMPDLVLVHRDEKFLYVNPAMIKTLGFTPENVQNKPIVDYIVPKYHERVAVSIRKWNAAQPLDPYEIEIRSKSGELRTVIVRGALIEFGGSPAILNVLTDVTERRRADQKLQESEGRYSALFDRNYSISLLIDPGTACIVDANDAACRYYGFSRDQLMARGIYDLNRLPREKVISHLIRAKNEREKHFLSTHYLANGERRNVEIYSGPITVQGRPLFYSIIHDITDRKQMEQSLRESEQRYHNIIEDQTEFICRFTPDGTHVFINDAYARYFGKTREELIGRIFHPDIFQDDREKVRQFFATLTPVHPVDYIQHRIIMPDGEVRWQQWSDRAIFDDDGSVIEYQSVGRDVTAHKQIEEALHIANTKLNLLFSITRHDIFNQLVVLDGYLDMLHEEIPAPDKSDYFARIANTSSMIGSIIRFTEAYEQIGVHLPVWQDIGIQVTATGRTIDTGRINLVNHLPAGMEVNADPMIMKVFFNLLDNSIRHGQRVTMIRVSCRESDEGLTILWEDDGVGIPEKEKSLIFKRGYGKNTGLGLFLVQEILSINEITIKETGEPGKGARFEIAVPKGRYRFTGAGEE